MGIIVRDKSGRVVSTSRDVTGVKEGQKISDIEARRLSVTGTSKKSKSKRAAITSEAIAQSNEATAIKKELENRGFKTNRATSLANKYAAGGVTATRLKTVLNLRASTIKNAIKSQQVGGTQDKPVFTVGTALYLQGRKPQGASQVKYFTDSSGKVTGIEDPYLQMSYQLDTPVDKSKLQRGFTEKQLQKEFVEKEKKAVKFSKPAEEFRDTLRGYVTKDPVIKSAVTAIEKAKWTKNKGYDRLTEELRALDVRLQMKGGKPEDIQFQFANALRIFPGIAQGFVNIYGMAANPVETTKNFGKFIKELYKNPVSTAKTLTKAYGDEFLYNPYGFIGELIGETGSLAFLEKAAKANSVVRYINRERFLRSIADKEVRTAVRKILNATEAQRGFNPNKRTPRKIDFLEIKELNPIEAQAVRKALEQTDSVVFGSVATRALSGGKTKVPKDIDIATRSIERFNTKFLENVPTKYRNNYSIRKEAIYRNGVKVIDVKPLSRLRPGSIFGYGRGALPIYTTKSVQGKKILRLAPFEIKTERAARIGQIKLTTFSEQTARKALGTLQVLLERNPRRAKDASALLELLEIQLNALKKSKPKTILGRVTLRRKITKIEEAIKFMKSKDFERILNSKIPNLTKEFPLVQKINPKSLKKLRSRRFKAGKKQFKRKTSRRNKFRDRKVGKRKVKKRKDRIKNTKKKQRKSSLPKKSRLPRRSKLPRKSKLPKRSSLPRRSGLPRKSKLPKTSILPKTSKIPGVSKLPKASKLPATSKIPKTSKIPGVSKLPKASKLPTSSKLPSRKTIKSKKIVKTLRRRLDWTEEPPAGYTYKVQPYIRSRGTVRRLGNPTTKNRGIKRATTFTDNYLVQSMDIKIVGLTRAKDIRGNFLQKFRKRYGKDPKVLQIVEKKKYILDRPREKINIARARRTKSAKKTKSATIRKNSRKRRVTRKKRK